MPGLCRRSRAPPARGGGLKLLLDQNLCHRIVGALRHVFPDSAHVRDSGLGRAEDADIWLLARERGFVIVSKDDDFNQRALLLGHPPKVVWIRLGNCPTSRVIEALREAAEEMRAFVADAEQCLMVISPTGMLRR